METRRKEVRIRFRGLPVWTWRPISLWMTTQER